MGFWSNLRNRLFRRRNRVVAFISQEGRYLGSRPLSPDDDEMDFVSIGDGKVLIQKGNNSGDAMRGRPRMQRLSNFAFKEYSFSSLDGGAYDDNLFREITAGSFVDTPRDVHDRLVKLSLLQYKKNARAFSSIEVVKDFVLGEEIIIDAADEAVQELIEEFWCLNEFEDKLEERLRSLAITGEQLYPLFVDASQMIRLSSIFPLQIVEVLRNVENAEDLQEVEAVVRDTSVDQRTGSVVLTGDADRFKILKAHDITQIADGKLDISEGKYCFFFAVNRVAGGTRGQPDLTPVMDWVEGMDSFLFTVLERADLAMQVVFDLQCEGLDEAELQKKSDKFVQNLKSGQAYAHNEKVTLDVKTPNLGSADASEIYGVLSRMICAGTRLPGMFFGDSADLARASASEMAVPTAKMLGSRQRFIKRMITRCIDLQIAHTRGYQPDRLKGVTDFKYQVRMPKIMLKDTSMITKSIKGLADALAAALDRMDPFIDAHLAKKIFANALMDLDPGEDYLQDYSKQAMKETDEDMKTLPPDVLAAYQDVKSMRSQVRMKNMPSMQGMEEDDDSGEG